MVVALTALVGLASAGEGVDWGRLVLATAAMLLSQLAIGWTNDYVDRESDARFQPEKPVARGEVDAKLLPPVALMALGCALAFGILLGTPALLFLALGTCAGLAYNVGLKGTRWSWAPFVLGFAMLPPFVWSATDSFRGELAWLYLVAPPLAFAAHVSNGLPDLEADRLGGRTTLSVRLGRSGSVRLVAACLLLTPLLAALTATAVSYAVATLAAAISVYSMLSAAALALLLKGPAKEGAAMAFRLVAGAGVVFTFGWLAAV